ncbi:hypothetical protein PVAND_000973 [Polypedilum vanderplanki]|uniref:Uncharacterized protein n=1 Tax=Polypedilum vanderplanki TaxID=319348 RepID=A0A9J6BLI2_POLVA|nr:hypothetical protein PVAND_000973 [Polypedilum vanderplanki]
MSLMSMLVLLLVLATSISGNDLNGPKTEALVQTKTATTNDNLPIFPERSDAVYFVVAVSGGIKSWGRALARTLLDIGDIFNSPHGPPLRPIYVDLPANGRFSAKILTTLCEQIDGIPISGIVVIGDGQAARSIALSGNAMQVPVLWAKGGTAQLQESSETQNYLQATLQPSAKEILEAIRAIFLQTHWHSFFVLSDIGSTMVLNGNLGNILKKSPLSPTVLPLSSNSKDNKDEVFRQLAKISRSTRGVVLLLCDLNIARRIMSEATRLKMTGGHFIWLWADTSSTAEFFQPSDISGSGSEDKSNYDEFMGRKNGRQQQIYQQQQQANRRNNQTRFKSMNSNRFHHIVGVRKSTVGDESFMGLPPPAQSGYLKGDKHRDIITPTNQIPVKDKRRDQKRVGVGKKATRVEEPNTNDDESANRRLNIKNINSNEFNANYYDPYSPAYRQNIDESDFDDSTDEELNVYYDYDKSNPFSAAVPATSSTIRKDAQMRSLIDDDDENDEKLDLENFSESTNDSKSKRADNSFNISSHVFFHHFKDFPVGLLALRHIKMNVDRVFVRSAIRLFASTWAKVEKNEEIRAAMGSNSGTSTTSSINKLNIRKMSTTFDYDEYGDMFRITNNNNKIKNKANVNNRYSSTSVRGTRKYKREAQTNRVTANSERSILPLVNSSDKTINLIKNESGLNTTQQMHSSVVEIKSNIDTISRSINLKTLKLNSSDSSQAETVEHGRISDDVEKREVNKRQQTNWWLSNKNGNVKNQQDKVKVTGTLQYKGGCFGTLGKTDLKRSEIFARYLREAVTLALSGKSQNGGNVEKEKALISNFEILNLVPSYSKVEESKNDMKSPQTDPVSTKWRRVGLVLGRKVHLDTIVWPGGDIVVSGLSARARSVFRVVTSLSPPFVMESNLDEDGLCLRGLPCHRLSTSGKHNLTLMFNSIETNERLLEDAVEHGNQIPVNEDHKSNDKLSYNTRCCYGLSMDLLDNVASELGFGYILYIVSDELFGSKQIVSNKKSNIHDFNRSQDPIQEQSKERERSARKFNKKQHDQPQWNGIIGDLVAGSADMSFAPLSVSKARAEVIDFSAPYFHSGISLLAAPKARIDIPLFAFLMPFSPELWIGVFIWLNLTAIAVAIYEWLSPFGLNPWGRQRSKNFSLSSALWVMWGLLFGHLVAFKAPKSWPNKFLINVWGGFSVIFIASYTANIAALIAGLFFQNSANTYDTSLLTQRVGIPRASAAESYIQRYDKHLWERMKKYTFNSIEEGIQGLKNGTIDLLMADSPILDYYRGSDHGCNLRRIGENYVEDTYAIGMSKGFPLKESISALIAKYSSNGYLDILVEKWYGGLPCYRDEDHIEIVQPRPLGVEAVAGVFLLLGLGMILGVFILVFEHMFFKYYLPRLRHQPKGSIWRSRNLMFFSQKLYRFINCVELVSPHHAARELVHTLRKGHITSLFQKSVKRKEDEQRRRRKSKAQFFEMIQEIRRVQQEEKEQPQIPKLEVVEEAVVEPSTPIPSSPNPEIQSIASSATSVQKPKASPKLRLFSLKRDSNSRSNSSSLNVRRFSTDSILGERLDTIGRRLSRDIASDLANSPPDLGHRFETFGKAMGESKFDTFSGKTAITKSADNLDKPHEKSKFDTFSGTVDDHLMRPELPVKKNQKLKPKRKPLSVDTYELRPSFESQSTLPLRDLPREPSQKESFRDTLHPAIFQIDHSKAVLRDKLHEELREKYGANNKKPLLKAKPPKVPSINHRPPLRIQSQNPNDSFLKVQSNDAPSSRPVPSPRTSKQQQTQRFTDDDDDDQPDPTYATIQPRNKSPRLPPQNPQHHPQQSMHSNLPLGRLSKEDLLDLSQKSESEIHEFLNGGNKTKQKTRMDPP